MKILTQRLFALSVNRTKMFVPPHFFTLCDLQFHKYVTKPPLTPSQKTLIFLMETL